MRIDFMLSNDTGEKHLMYCKSDIKEMITVFHIGQRIKIIEELFDPFLQR